MRYLVRQFPNNAGRCAVFARVRSPHAGSRRAFAGWEYMTRSEDVVRDRIIRSFHENCAPGKMHLASRLQEPVTVLHVCSCGKSFVTMNDHFLAGDIEFAMFRGYNVDEDERYA